MFRRALRKTQRISSPAKEVMAIQFPPKRLELALHQLNSTEHDRRQGQVAESNGGPSTFSSKKSYANIQDNRWGNVVAYDHALLSGPYLNACLIPSFPSSTSTNGDSKRSYIASQAPLPHTLTTFYRHVVQNKVQLIVNLTPFKERGRRKADEYWPLEPGQTFQTQADDQGRSYNVRQDKAIQALDEQLDAKAYSIALDGGDLSESYSLRILHITSWADFGEMDESTFGSLLDMVRQQAGPADAPVWVHCSAGIGRSGTIIGGLIAQDLGVESLQKVAGLKESPTTPTAVMEAALTAATLIVDHERKYRPGMVQTPEQLGMVAGLVGQILQQR